MEPMKVYTTTDFYGHYPVGTAAVVVARDKGHARRILEKELKKRGLELKAIYGDKNGKVKMDLIDLGLPEKARAVVLNDGNF